MLNILSSFIIDFLCTAFLFVLSIIIVLGVKTLLLMLKDFAPSKNLETEIVPATISPKKPKRKRHSRKVNKPSISRSIEIDPNSVDKIYVKKSS